MNYFRKHDPNPKGRDSANCVAAFRKDHAHQGEPGAAKASW
jgi:hypothetical protein